MESGMGEWERHGYGVQLTGRILGRTSSHAGAVAQMGERCNRTAEVVSSNLISSTKHSPLFMIFPPPRKSPQIRGISSDE